VSKKNYQHYYICLLFSTMMVLFFPYLLKAQSAINSEKADSQPTNVIEPFNYGGVSLLDGMFKNQYTQTRDYYLNISNDDILKGFREQAGLPAPGKHMGGWCSKSSAVVFGQLLSGMARMYKATGDEAMREKAVLLMREWSKTLSSMKLGHYSYDKNLCGLIDLYEYAGVKEAIPLIEKITEYAIENLGRIRNPASVEDHSAGRHTGEGEWYTLSENIYRMYLLTGDEKFKNFGDVWRYPHYWGMFTGKTPLNLEGLHAYSHVNSLSGAAMAYAVTGDSEYLKTIINAYDYFQKTQCYATGGYGPSELLAADDGILGRSIEAESKAFYGHWPVNNIKNVGRSFETVCGSWAVFKLCRYLMSFTGEARFGDWMEKVLYNGIGSALPMGVIGKTFYYSDYRVGGASKKYYNEAWPCCSGTYIQAVADYHNLIYFKDEKGLYVNLFVPSEVKWSQQGKQIEVRQETAYPEAETTTLILKMKKKTHFSIRFRVPEWTQNAAVELNGVKLDIVSKPGTWSEVEREWASDDRITFRIPKQIKLIPVDKQHPHLVAATYGPVVLVREQNVISDSSPQDFLKNLVPGKKSLHFKSENYSKSSYKPFYQIEYDKPYEMYFPLRK
jgi:DUF1680 family protein